MAVLVQAVPAVPPTLDGEIAKLKPGKQATIKLSSGKKLAGEVRELNQDSLSLRVDRGFFRHRTEVVPYSSIVEVTKGPRTWVGPVVVAGVVGGVLIGLSACLSSGACWR